MTTQSAEDLFATARDKNPNAAIAAYNGFQRDLKRIIARTEALGDFEEIDITPSDNGKIAFMGRRIADNTYTTRGRDPMQIEMEVWETRGGALIAVIDSTPAERDDGFTVTRACTVEPAEDYNAMCRKVMDFFGWSPPARKLAGKAGWKLHSWID